MTRKMALILLALAIGGTGLLHACGTATTLTPATRQTERLNFHLQVVDWGGGDTKIVTVYVEDRHQKEVPTITVGAGLKEDEKYVFGGQLVVTKWDGRKFGVMATFNVSAKQLANAEVLVEHVIKDAPSGAGGTFRLYPRDFVEPKDKKAPRP